MNKRRTSITGGNHWLRRVPRPATAINQICVKVSTTFEEDSFNQSAFMIDDYLRRRVFDIEVEDFQ
jgi:hypothetical protein